jgi:lipopolysaccharide/colanic/teichoic acid biosynthesis glycosyltransferase
MRKAALLLIDLSWVALSPFLAVVLRDNFVIYPDRLDDLAAYSAILVIVSAVTFLSAGLNKTLWQYTSLSDVLRVIGAVTIALLLSLFMGFVLNRLEGVARSLPVIQWLLLVSALIGVRVGARVWSEQRRRGDSTKVHSAVQHTLIVGVNQLTELYLRSIAEYAADSVHIVGILSERRHLHGRLLRQQKVLGRPEDLPKVMVDLEVHGVTIARIAVMQTFDQLSRPVGEALLAVERSSCVKVDWLVERLGLTHAPSDETPLAPSILETCRVLGRQAVQETRSSSLRRYGYVKRLFDILAALLLGLALGPLFLIIGLLVVADVGFPLVFWQLRPGRTGRLFKLFKFRTMCPAHDAQGNRIADNGRSSKVGRLLRRTGLDELPQLYNILIGEMSFVGPRPLLPVDQPVEKSMRLLVRPGLTGLAQIYGGRDILPEEKNALDIWYIQNASPWLDIRILLRTLIVIMRGERLDQNTLRGVWTEFEPLHTQATANPLFYSLTARSVVGEEQSEIAPVS